MSELTELKKTMADGFIGIHRRLDTITDDLKRTDIQLATHLGNPVIHTKPPCSGFKSHLDNHGSWRILIVMGAGLLVSLGGLISYIVFEAIKS